MKNLLARRHHPSFRQRSHEPFEPKRREFPSILHTTGSTWIYESTADDEIGSHNAGASNRFEGKILWSQVKDGIDGTVTTFFDARSSPEGLTAITDSRDNIWSLFGNAAIVAYTTVPQTFRAPTARRSNIVDYDNDGSEKPVTGLAIIGQGEGDDQKLFFVQQTLGDIPLWEGKITLKDQGEDQLLLDRGNFCLATSADVTSQYTITLDTDLPPFLGDISVGDYIRTVINDNFTQEDDLFWVGRMRITLSKQQDEQITLEITQ